jgi:hypothetical protein
MKRILTILLALQLLTGNQFFAELVKIPSLIEHFQEHKAANQDLDFFTFLKMHYSDPEHQKSDARHDNLPLKVHSSAHAEIFVFSLETPSSVSEPMSQNIENKTQVIKNHQFSDSKIRFSVFQPPRLV